VGSLVKVAGQTGRGKKRKANNRSELNEGPASNQDSAMAKGRGKQRRNGNGVTVMDLVVTAADVGAAVTETRSHRMSNLPAHL
jgi:hypothetical protein